MLALSNLSLLVLVYSSLDFLQRWFLVFCCCWSLLSNFHSIMKESSSFWIRLISRYPLRDPVLKIAVSTANRPILMNFVLGRSLREHVEYDRSQDTPLNHSRLSDFLIRYCVLYFTLNVRSFKFYCIIFISWCGSFSFMSLYINPSFQILSKAFSISTIQEDH